MFLPMGKRTLATMLVIALGAQVLLTVVNGFAGLWLSSMTGNNLHRVETSKGTSFLRSERRLSGVTCACGPACSGGSACCCAKPKPARGTPPHGGMEKTECPGIVDGVLLVSFVVTSGAWDLRASKGWPTPSTNNPDLHIANDHLPDSCSLLPLVPPPRFAG